MVNFNNKIWKAGGSYVVTIPRDKIESGELQEGQLYYFEVSNLQAVPIQKEGEQA